jgi:hypothetical protein
MGQRRRIRLPLPTDPAVKAALITATASVLVAVIGAISAFAVGWLQVGPGARYADSDDGERRHTPRHCRRLRRKS